MAAGGDRGPNRLYILLRGAPDLASFKYAGHRRPSARTIRPLGAGRPPAVLVAAHSLTHPFRYARRPISLRTVAFGSAFGSKKAAISTRECRVGENHVGAVSRNYPA
jgi:hypothetical protein